MDFAEDYECQTQDEVQSAYWNATHVAIHRVVTAQKHQLRKHYIVYISDEQSHCPLQFWLS